MSMVDISCELPPGHVQVCRHVVERNWDAVEAVRNPRFPRVQPMIHLKDSAQVNEKHINGSSRNDNYQPKMFEQIPQKLGSQKLNEHGMRDYVLKSVETEIKVMPPSAELCLDSDLSTNYRVFSKL